MKRRYTSPGLVEYGDAFQLTLGGEGADLDCMLGSVQCQHGQCPHHTPYMAACPHHGG